MKKEYKYINYMEIIGILSLSLLITSTMAVSGGVPEMIKEFTTENSSSIYTRSTIELMMSVPGYSIMLIIALTPFLTKHIKERTMIGSGLLLIGISGLVPVFISSLPLIFISRIFLGIGIGLVNTLAVTLIGERFSGDLRQKLQGMRCSMETLGEASLIFIAGQLLVFGWNYAFLVYGFAFVILILYWFFVPETPHRSSSTEDICETKKHTEKISFTVYMTIAKYSLLGLLLVSTLSSNALRISSFVVESGFGTAVTGSTALSVSIFTGFIGGLTFGKFLKLMPRRLLSVSCFFIAAGFCLLVFGNSLAAVIVGASICGFFTTIALSHMFNALSDNLPTEALNTGNALVLVGCNLGGILSPFILKFVGVFHPSLAAGFLFYGGIYLLLGIGALLYSWKR